MANLFTDLNNFIKQNPLEYMAEFGIQIETKGNHPCPICGGNDRFRWCESGRNANTGYCRDKDGVHGDKRNILQPLHIIEQVTKLELKDIGARLGFNRSEKLGNPKHIYLRPTIKKTKQGFKLDDLNNEKLELFSNGVNIELKNATWRESPYLLTKGISKMMWVGGHGQTLLDYCRADGTLCALQRIPEKSGQNKLFISNSQKTGAFHCERNCEGDIRTIFIGEGFGTVTALQYSISEMYPSSLFLTAGNDGNLLSVAIEVRKYYPNADICILTDNDHAGLKATINVMTNVKKCWWAMPVNVGEDWCDVFQRGKFAVCDEFQRVLTDRKPSI